MQTVFLISGANAVYLPLVLIALGAGFLVFADQKGTADHKFWGRFYFLFSFAVSVVHLSSPSSFQNAFDIWLPAMNLAALSIAFGAIRTARGKPSRIRLHAYAMSFSFALFLAAAIANLMSALAFSQTATLWSVLGLLALSLVILLITLPGVLARSLKDLT